MECGYEAAGVVPNPGATGTSICIAILSGGCSAKTKFCGAMEAVETFELAAKAVSTKVVRSTASGLEAAVEALLRQVGAKSIVTDSRRVNLSSFERAEPAFADAGITDAEWGIAS